MLSLDFGIIGPNAAFLWEGMKITLWLTLLSIIGAAILGTIIVIARLFGPLPLRLMAFAYVNLCRSVPLVLVVFWFYFLVPLVIGRPVGQFFSVLIAFILFEAAYFSETMRAGIQSVPRGQLAAAISTGLTLRQSFQYIVLPQGVRKMAPVLLTQCIILFQDTSVAYVVALNDFLTSTSIIAQSEARPIEMYTFAAGVYLTICLSISFLVESRTWHR
ncbi:amino acid ABC transporter permease [Bradyrhizobium sp. USDA 336]|uniref:amino acid ABC transporter permease n=1 Tax=Bradyrhizobium sp. USDA 336 TaxID=3156311 RepID=UPI003838E0E3